jgi:hypothetical protein
MEGKETRFAYAFEPVVLIGVVAYAALPEQAPERPSEWFEEHRG